MLPTPFANPLAPAENAPINGEGLTRQNALPPTNPGAA